MKISAWIINPKKIISKLERRTTPLIMCIYIYIYGGPRQNLFLTYKYLFMPYVCCCFFIHKINQQIFTYCVLQISKNISILKLMHFLFLGFSHQQPHGPTWKGNLFVSDILFFHGYSQSPSLCIAPFLHLSSTVFSSAMMYINKLCNSFTIYFHSFLSSSGA